MTLRRRIERIEARLGRGWCSTCSWWTQEDAIRYVARHHDRESKGPVGCPTCRAPFPLSSWLEGLSRATNARGGDGSDEAEQERPTSDDFSGDP